MRPVPEDPEAERSLLATLCQPGAEMALASLLPRLCVDDFLHPSCRAVFQAILAISARRQEIGFVTLRSELKTSGHESVQLMAILDGQEVGHPDVLVNILTGHRHRRELLRLGDQILHQGEDLLVEPEETIHDAQAELARIARDGASDPGESWMEILHQMAAFESFRAPGPERGGWWGIPTLDQVAPIPVGEFAVIGARPGVGKTALFTQVAIASARHGIKPLTISLELSKASLKARLASHLSGVSIADLKQGRYSHDAIQAVGQEGGLLEMGRLQAPVAGTPWSKIEAMIRHEVDRYGVQLVLLDQFDKIGRPGIQKGSSEAYAFGAVSTGIVGLTQELGIGFVLCCQLKGDAEGREPTLADHADSDRPGKDSAVVLHLWRNKDNVLKGKIQKNRDGSNVGRRLDLDLLGHCQTIREVDSETIDRKVQFSGGVYS